MPLLGKEAGMKAGTVRSEPGRRELGRWALWAVIALLLLLPLVAMQFTREIKWSGSDFAAAGILLVGAGLVYELAVRRIGGRGRRKLAAGALLAALLIAWAQGAVGVV
jgi:hypothetical protein